jgi:hypothetical protein
MDHGVAGGGNPDHLIIGRAAPFSLKTNGLLRFDVGKSNKEWLKIHPLAGGMSTIDQDGGFQPG